MTQGGTPQEAVELALFNQMMAPVGLDLSRVEKPLRHKAYDAIRDAGTRLLSGDIEQAYHATYFDIDGDTAERRVLLARARVPGHGNLLRVILNERTMDLRTDELRIDVSDFVISTIMRTHTVQRTAVKKERTAESWPINAKTGPLVLSRAGRLEVVSGSEYDIHIPKTRGFPKNLGQLIDGRIALEELSGVLEGLSGVTYDPDAQTPYGFMS